MTEALELEVLVAEPCSAENAGTAHSCQRFLPGLSALETKLPPPGHLTPTPVSWCTSVPGHLVPRLLGAALDTWALRVRRTCATEEPADPCLQPSCRPLRV